MNKELNEALIKALEDILDLKENGCFCGNCEDEKQEKHCEHLISLQKEFNDILLWAFGKESGNSTLDRREARKIWEKKHAKYPIPRILLSKQELNVTLSTACLILDVYPIYLIEKKKCCG